ncbi:MAG: hypothetical protein C0448_04855 [Sphingobacteriaceae bacterium]|nr:hypothetical protein [Sphingobacteriaceae bacterium]
MLIETNKILHKYQVHYKDLYASASTDLKPQYASYGNFDEIDHVYVFMCNLRETVRDKLFGGQLDLEYITPVEVVEDIQENHNFFFNQLSALQNMTHKYEKAKLDVPNPIGIVRKYTTDLVKILDYVLALSEVKEIINPNLTVDRLHSELVDLKTQSVFKRSMWKAVLWAFVYFLLCVAVISSITILSLKGQKYSWTPALLAIIPILDSWLYKDGLKKSLRLIFSKKTRQELQAELRNRINNS